VIAKMNWDKEIMSDKNLQTSLRSFCNRYGISGLKQAMKLYADMHHEYVCKTKISVTKIKIGDIYYLEICGHDISIHTHHGIYHKYGTLSKELDFLARYGFLKCNQSCLVSLNKIRTIDLDDIILINGSKLHMSRNYASKVLWEFYKKK